MPGMILQNSRVKPRRKTIYTKKKNILFTIIFNIMLSIISGLIAGMIMSTYTDFYMYKHNLFSALLDIRKTYVQGQTLLVTGIDFYKILKIQQIFAFMGHESAARDTGRIRSLLEDAINETDLYKPNDKIFLRNNAECIELASSLSPNILRILQFWQRDIIHQ